MLMPLALAFTLYALFVVSMGYILEMCYKIIKNKRVINLIK